jgi:hypothetical protein
MRIAKMVVRAVLMLVPALAVGHLRCDLQNVYGVASINGDNTYLAIWRHADQENILDIYSGLECTDAGRVAHFEDKGTPWQSLSAIEDLAVLGFRVRTIAAIAFSARPSFSCTMAGSFVNRSNRAKPQR